MLPRPEDAAWLTLLLVFDEDELAVVAIEAAVDWLEDVVLVEEEAGRVLEARCVDPPFAMSLSRMHD